jgi:phasin family protein
MAKNTDNYFQDFFSQSLFDNFQTIKWEPNLEPFIKVHEKQLQRINKVQKATLNGLQDLTKKQTQIVSQIIQDQTELVRELIVEGTPEEKFSRQAHIAKDTYEKSLDNMQEISNVIQSMSETIAKEIADQISESLEDLDFTNYYKAA